MIENSFVQPAVLKFDGHFQAIDRSVLETILNKDTTKNIWDSLKQKYQGTTRVKRAHLQALWKEFEIVHMKAGESMNDYFA